MSATALWIMCAVIVVALAIWLITVGLAARRPYFRNAHPEARRGRVQGGTHIGGGRSVAPRRDAPVTPGETPDDSTLPEHAGRPGSGSGNPLDL
jgi:hypothetical protein